jgi:hypothetical protein
MKPVAAVLWSGWNIIDAEACESEDLRWQSKRGCCRLDLWIAKAIWLKTVCTTTTGKLLDSLKASLLSLGRFKMRCGRSK